MRGVLSADKTPHTDEECSVSADKIPHSNKEEVCRYKVTERDERSTWLKYT